MTNIALATSVLRACASAGVHEIVLCAGARNAPLVTVLSAVKGVHTYSFFEERSAAFFALGRMQSSGRPVAIVTTSGTAVAELLPAAIEADYQGLPLILISADRPRRYRGSGAPQTIVQPGLFSHYVERSWDIEGEWESVLEWSQRRPIHVNVCFDEPLLDEDLPAWDWRDFERRPSAAVPSGEVEMKFQRPLVLIGGLPAHAAKQVEVLVRGWNRPVYAEAPSQLRGRFADLEIPESAIKSVECDGLLHIGSVPTVRFWRDLESSGLPVQHFSHLPFSGLPRSNQVHPLSALQAWKFDSWQMPDALRARKFRLAGLLEEYPLSEPGWMNWLSRQLPPEARVFLGNSLPIREWDLAAAAETRAEIFVNRGVNGIDGLISTFLGVSEPERSNWAVIGDLSALYDLSGPWALQQRPLEDINLVVINNGGGKIFHRIFHNPLFENRHGLRFGDWARMWNLDYIKLERPETLPTATRPRVIEIIPSEAQTESFWRDWEAKT